MTLIGPFESKTFFWKFDGKSTFKACRQNKSQTGQKTLLIDKQLLWCLFLIQQGCLLSCSDEKWQYTLFYQNTISFADTQCS